MAILTRNHGWSARLRDDSGTAAVEFAIVVPILLLVVFGIIDFGRALWTLNVATSALREGARFGAAQVTSTTTTCSAALSGVTTKVQNYLTSALGSGATTGVNIAADCDANNYIRVCYVASGSVCASGASAPAPGPFPFTPIAPLVSRFTATEITVPTAVFRWEKAG
jgi:Flp pilus assembly protein TadG